MKWSQSDILKVIHYCSHPTDLQAKKKICTKVESLKRGSSLPYCRCHQHQRARLWGKKDLKMLEGTVFDISSAELHAGHHIGTVCFSLPTG
jgi:hypothetical protein